MKEEMWDKIKGSLGDNEADMVGADSMKQCVFQAMLSWLAPEALNTRLYIITHISFHTTLKIPLNWTLYRIKSLIHVIFLNSFNWYNWAFICNF